MIVGENPAIWLKEKSKSLSIPFFELLQIYVQEDLLFRLNGAANNEIFWKKREHSLDLYYLEDGKKIPNLSKSVLEEIFFDLLGKENEHEIAWKYIVEEAESGFRVLLNAEYEEMEVPISFFVWPLLKEGKVAEKRSTTPVVLKEKEICYFIYSFENVLAESFFEIMEKLELISTMESYYMVNEILRDQAVSGRYIMEVLASLAENKPKMKNPKRLEQLKSYENYEYMRRKWDSYCKKQKAEEKTSWKELMDRLISFATPIWECFCNDEIFFDDWMPGLGRFLG